MKQKLELEDGKYYFCYSRHHSEIFKIKYDKRISLYWMNKNGTEWEFDGSAVETIIIGMDNAIYFELSDEEVMNQILMEII